jgi:hypothetical protein
MDTFLCGYNRKGIDNEAGSSDTTEASSNREMTREKPKCTKHDTKYLSLGFTSIDVD